MVNDSLQPMTKLVLAISAAVQALFGLAMVFSKDVFDNLVWPRPFETVPTVAVQFSGILYLACAIGAAYALSQNSWVAGRTYLVTGASYNLMAIILSLFAAANPPGIPDIFWLYILLAVIYLALVAIVWRQQSAQAASRASSPAAQQTM